MQRTHMLPNRDSCEVLAGEVFEQHGSLTYLERKNAEHLTVRCIAKACGGVMSFTLDRSCDWILRKFEACTCSGPGTVSPATGSAAIPTEALLEVIKPLVFGDPHVKSAAPMAALEPIIFRAPCSSLIQRLRDARHG